MFQHGANDEYWEAKGEKVRLGNPIDLGETFIVVDPSGDVTTVN